MEHGSTPLLVLHDVHADLPAHHASVHVEHGLTFVQAGSLSFECGERVQVGPGSVVLIPSGMPYRSHGGTGVTYWMAGFCSSCQGLDEGMPLMEPFRRVRNGALPIATIPEARHGWMQSLFVELQAASLTPRNPDPIPALLALLLGEVATAMQADAPASDTLVGQALRFIQREAFRPISLADVARAVHRSPAHVATTVKKATGHTVGDWLTAQRVAEAARWLSHTDAGLDTIAERVGWSDTTHLIRMFKRSHGMTPAAWRRQRQHRALSEPPAPS